MSALLLRALAGLSIVREAAAPGDDRHAERGRAPGHLLPDMAEAEQAEGAAVQPARLGVLLLVPLPLAQFDDVVGDAAIDRQYQRHRQFRDGDRILARAVRHVDAAPRSRRDIDRVDAGARANDERQASALQHLRGHFRAADHEHLRAALVDGARQRLVFQFGLVDDLAPAGFQAVDAALLEFVSNQDLHMT
jgi:hypothetical protein